MLNLNLDRLKICEVYALIEYDWNKGGIVRERPSNARRNASTGVQLHRMQVRFSPLFNYRYEELTEDQQSLYDYLVVKWGLV